MLFRGSTKGPIYIYIYIYIHIHIHIYIHIGLLSATIGLFRGSSPFRSLGLAPLIVLHRLKSIFDGFEVQQHDFWAPGPPRKNHKNTLFIKTVLGKHDPSKNVKNRNFRKKPLRFSDSLRKININDGGFVISC